MDKLIQLGFKLSAKAVIQNGSFKIEIIDNENSQNVLYAFVLVNGEDIANWQVRYIGHTRKTFRNRMNGYQQGAGKAVNNRIHIEMKNHLENNKTVFIYCMTDFFNMNMHSLHIDVAAGLEYSLIGFYQKYNEINGHPTLQNIAGNKKIVDEIFKHNDLEKVDKLEEDEDYDNDLQDSNKKNILAEFEYKLNKTYWNYPFINIPVEFSKYFGENNESATLSIFNGSDLLRNLNLRINRNAVSNGTPRFIFSGEDGTWFQEWKQKNYKFGDSFIINIIFKNKLEILN